LESIQAFWVLVGRKGEWERRVGKKREEKKDLFALQA